MLEQDLQRFAALIATVGEVFGKPLTSAVIGIYWGILKDFKFEEVKKATDRYLAHPDAGKYMPKPADIVMAIEGSSQNQALLAWTKALAATHRVGIYTSIAFDDALIHTVIKDMGGWCALCSIETNRLPFASKEFQERYRGYVIQKPTRHPSYLAGIIESQNSASGYFYAPPVLFGNKEQAIKVIETGKHDGPLLGVDQLTISVGENE